MKKTIKDFDLSDKRVIIRCDLNVPMKNDTILDDNRIIESIPTIRYAINNNAKVIILSHLGRIKTEEDKKGKSLLSVSQRLEELLGRKVTFIKQTRGNVLINCVNNMKAKDVVLVENTRFEDIENKESGNDSDLADYWASLGDIFINDAFGTSHRAHASNVGIASILPSGIGFLIEKELNALNNELNNPKHPYVVIMGGAKVHDKINVINNLVSKADYILLGGGISNTFLTAQGFDLKKSIYDKESLDYCQTILNKYKEKIVLPVDGYSSVSYQEGLETFYQMLDNVKEDTMVLDIGPKSIEKFKNYILSAKTIFLNGPVGVSEFKNFEYGTKEILSLLEKSEASVIVGGGDSAAAAIKFGYKDKFSHISTGGGAALELIEGKKLPGIEVIQDK